MENKWTVWKTIKLGTGLTNGDDFRRALKSSAVHLDNKAGELLDLPSFKVASQLTQISLVNVSGEELGLVPGLVTLKEIHGRANGKGLELCTAEVAPQLCLQYGDPPNTAKFNVGMLPMIDSFRRPYFLTIDGDKELFLIASPGNLDRKIHTSHSWVFVLAGA